ncbi:DoxX family protein [Vampirovibrio chlorellavorus]|uniref:DoxX family protein n=1 Tax=Vampirovibrio chlorellavorus TaxID=758823 RepID=UPI0026EF9A78|nr:DoxX family protein [Vampirovibrio chlorellavorus]
MNLNTCFQSKTWPSVGLLAFRVVMGIAFVFHGLPKAQNAFGWMGEGTIPGIFQAFAAYAEVLGGAALALGFLTPLASLVLIGTMVGALGLVHIPGGHPFVSSSGESSSELAAVYLSGALLFLLNSAGKFSVDYWLWRAKFNSAQTSA